MAVASPDVRKEMMVEDEILTEIENRDTEIMMRDKVIKQKDQQLEQTTQQLEQTTQQLEQKDKQLEQKDQQLEQKDKELEQQKNINELNKRKLTDAVKNLAAKGMSTDEISSILSVAKDEVEDILK